MYTIYHLGQMTHIENFWFDTQSELKVGYIYFQTKDGYNKFITSVPK